MRLIDADALMKRIEDSARHAGLHQEDYCKIKRFIAKTPTIEAEPVRHGEWAWNEEDECYICSVCGETALNNYRGLSVASNGCPNCLSKMKNALSCKEEEK